MKNKKIFFTALVLVVAGFITMAIGILTNTNLNKLKGDSSQVVDGVSIEITCDKYTLTVGESTDCEFFVNSGTTPVWMVAGKLQASSNLKVKGIETEDYDWASMMNEAFIFNGDGDYPTGKTKIADFIVKAEADGEGTLVFSEDGADTFAVEIKTGAGESDVAEVTIPKFQKAFNEQTTPPASTDATLSSAKFNSSNLSNNNTLTVANSVTSGTIALTASDSNATISSTYNSGNAHTGQGSVSYDINLGNPEVINTVNVTVTAEDGTTTRNYTYYIVREAEQVTPAATLNSLTIDGVNLSPAFSAGVHEYNATVPYSTSRINVGATSNQNVQGTGSHDLNVGSNTITLTVSGTGYIDATYTIYVTRESDTTPPEDDKDSDATIKEIKVNNNVVDLTKLSYTVDYEVTSVNIAVELNSLKARVSGKTGAQNVVVGTNSFVYVVTAENGTTRTYTLRVLRKDKEGGTPIEPDEPTLCELTSSTYNIDNDKHTINGVSVDHNNETVKSNISTTCGNITVDNDKVVLKYDDKIVEYRIIRAWAPNTGNDRINYLLIFGGICVLIGAALLVKFYLDKKKK